MVCLHPFLTIGVDQMEKKNIERNNRKRKILQLYGREPLLKSLDIEQLISMISPEEIEKAQVILKEYLEGFKHIDVERKIVPAYLIGELQGIDDMHNERAGKSLADRMIELHKTGFKYGYMLASLHYPQREKKDAE